MYIKCYNDTLINLDQVAAIDIDAETNDGDVFLKAVFPDGDWRIIATTPYHAGMDAAKVFEPIIKKILEHNSYKKYIVVEDGSLTVGTYPTC